MLDGFFFKQKTAYGMRISDWSSDVCSSDLDVPAATSLAGAAPAKISASSLAATAVAVAVTDAAAASSALLLSVMSSTKRVSTPTIAPDDALLLVTMLTANRTDPGRSAPVKSEYPSTLALSVGVPG